MTKDITLTADYHDRACVIRWYDHSTQKDQVFAEVLTTKKSLNDIVDRLLRYGPRGARGLDSGEHDWLGPGKGAPG